MASSDLTTIMTGLNTRVAAVLPTYSVLDFVYNIEKNKFNKGTSRYGIMPLDAIEVSGVTKHYTLDQRIKIVLTSGYKTDQLADTDLSSKIKTLMDLCHDIYNDLYSNRAGSPSLVMNIHEIAIDEPIIVETDKVVVVSMSFLLTYRRQLGI